MGRASLQVRNPLKVVNRRRGIGRQPLRRPERREVYAARLPSSDDHASCPDLAATISSRAKCKIASTGHGRIVPAVAQAKLYQLEDALNVLSDGPIKDALVVDAAGNADRDALRPDTLREAELPKIC